MSEATKAWLRFCFEPSPEFDDFLKGGMTIEFMITKFRESFRADHNIKFKEIDEDLEKNMPQAVKFVGGLLGLT